MRALSLFSCRIEKAEVALESSHLFNMMYGNAEKKGFDKDKLVKDVLVSVYRQL